MFRLLFKDCLKELVNIGKKKRSLQNYRIRKIVYIGVLILIAFEFRAGRESINVVMITEVYYFSTR